MAFKQALNRQNTMITYRYDEEKLTALYFADLLHDELARKIIEAGVVANSAEATPLLIRLDSITQA